MEGKTTQSGANWTGPLSLAGGWARWLPGRPGAGIEGDRATGPGSRSNRIRLAARRGQKKKDRPTHPRVFARQIAVTHEAHEKEARSSLFMMRETPACQAAPLPRQLVRCASLRASRTANLGNVPS